MTAQNQLCLLDSPDARSPATDGLLCSRHAYAIRHALNSIRDSWGDLDRRDDEPRSSAATFGRTATRVHSPVPIDVAAVDRAVDRQLDAARLCFWARAVASARRIDPVNFPSSTLGRIDLLILHLPWAIAQPAVVELFAELQAIRNRVRSALPVKAESVGLCRSRTPRGRCDGELLKDRTGIVRCHRDPRHIDHVRPNPKGS